MIKKVLIHTIACFIPNKKCRRAFRDKFLKTKYDYNRIKKSHTKILNVLKQKVHRGKKLKVAFLVVFDSVFPAVSLYEKMLRDDIFDPFIVVIPDVSRGNDNMFQNLKKSMCTLSEKYDNVICSYCYETNQFKDISTMCDLCISANPYEDMTHEYYGVQYLLKKNVLSFFVSYGYMPDKYGKEHIINLSSLNHCWKVYADTEENYSDFLNYTDTKGQNVVLSGYCKMDKLFEVKSSPRTRKKIIIAPHHTVALPSLPLSNFLVYAEFFKQLPSLYPNIDFVFRPHPLLYPTLCRDNIWGKEKTNKYFEDITKHDNLIWQDGGDYFETFVNSDGIIHDCSSFLIEYLFTGHPACYLLRDEKEIDDVFLDLGKNCLEHYYKAFNESQIINFIEKVILNEEDPLEQKREEYTNKYLKINYPRVTDFIINDLKKELR